MSFTVIRLPAAEQELAALWIASGRRDAVTAAVDELDRRLATDPSTEGESRDGAVRVTFEPPVAINFQVDAVNRTVFVGRAWEYR